MATGLSLFSRPATGQAQTRPGLSVAQLVELLESGVRPERVLTLAEESCLSFTPTPDTDAGLRTAGASDDLIAKLRGVCVRPAVARPAGPCVVSSIRLVSPVQPPLQKGRTIELGAVIAQSNCRNLGVSWQSSAPDIATVRVDRGRGMVSGIEPGDVVITATAGGVTGSMAITVLPQGLVVGVEAPNTLPLFDSAQARAVPQVGNDEYPAQVHVTWYSSDTTILGVSQTGLLTARERGVASVRTETWYYGSSSRVVRVGPARDRIAGALIRGTSSSPAAEHALNPKGGVITVARTRTGEYDIRIPGLGDPTGKANARTATTVFVTTTNSSPRDRTCTVVHWLEGLAAGVSPGDLVVKVRCMTLSGSLTPTASLADADFTVLALGAGALTGGSAGGLFGGDTFVTAQTLPAEHSWSSTGNAGTVLESAPRGTLRWITGIRRPRVPSMTLVSAYNASSPLMPTCGIRDADSTSVMFTCVDRQLRPVPSAATLLMLAAGRPDKRWGFASVDNPTVTAQVPAAELGSRSSNGQPILVDRQEKGFWRVRFTGLGPAAVAPLIHMAGIRSGVHAFCGIDSWDGTADYDVFVRCFDAQSNPVDVPFTVLIIE